MELPALPLPLPTRDPNNGTEPKPAAGALPSEPRMGPSQQIYALTINIAGDAVFLVPKFLFWTQKGHTSPAQAGLYVKNSFQWEIPWIP